MTRKGNRKFARRFMRDIAKLFELPPRMLRRGKRARLGPLRLRINGHEYHRRIKARRKRK